MGHLGFRARAVSVVAAALCALPMLVAGSAAAQPAAAQPADDAPTPLLSADGPFTSAGRWITDAQGRVFITSGINMVNKRAPYAPDAIGFDDDDAAFLAANGFDSV
ncbi:MAG: endoglycoceramidase, partial [Mycobacteriaceae bacterium]